MGEILNYEEVMGRLDDDYELFYELVNDFFDAYPDHAEALDHQMDGMDIKSIADVIGRSATATKELLSLARKKIAPLIDECL